MRRVRPVGEPCLPLKFRFEDEAQTSRPLSLSGFMARHIEQPASRNSKPAARRTLSQPFSTMAFRTAFDPGTAIARTPAFTLKALPKSSFLRAK